MITHLTDRLSVSPQVFPKDLPLLKQSGFRTIVNNRPDGEESGQPLSAELRRAARELGLGYEHIPIVSGQVTDDHAQTFREAIARTDGRVLAFCRTGNRSAKLWELAKRRG